MTLEQWDVVRVDVLNLIEKTTDLVERMRILTYAVLILGVASLTFSLMSFLLTLVRM